ncbi:MAG TPA: lysoplasmalogenase [Blastocatellia bacterium]|jgi:uncharacterized membrane protein YhhN
MSASAPATNSRRFDASDKLLLGVSLACGIAYLIARALEPYPAGVIVKFFSVSPLALLAFRSLRSRDGLILGVSLLFSSVGDVFLALGAERLFVFGLGSFLIAHLLYIALFVRNWPKPFKSSAAQKRVVALLTLYSAAMLAWLWPGLGRLGLPVTVYLCAITAMGVTATLAGFQTRRVITGALLFILSDSLIAIDKFKTPVEYGDYLIWGTYYLGQLLIVTGFLREKMRAERRGGTDV